MPNSDKGVQECDATTVSTMYNSWQQKFKIEL